MRQHTHNNTRRRPWTVASGLVARALLVGIMLWSVPGLAHAQGFDWPTLEELGVRYVSPDGLVQVKPSVRVEVDGFFPQDAPAWHLEDTSPFIAGRASLFVDLFVGRRLFASTELRVDRGQPARSGPIRGHVQQAFVRFTPAPGTNFHVQGGKFVSPFGGYPGRAHTAADPFIRPPLAYDFRTVMQPVEVPAAPDGVFTWKDRPPFRAAGLPIVWAVPYPVGLTVTAGKGPISGTAGMTTTAPSAEPSDWNTWGTDDPAGPFGRGPGALSRLAGAARGRLLHERTVHAVVDRRSGDRCAGAAAESGGVRHRRHVLARPGRYSRRAPGQPLGGVPRPG